MRISPLAIAYRAAPPAELRAATEAAVRATHRHPEAIDFAVVQAAAVAYALRCEGARDFDAQALLADLASRCTTEAMRGQVLATAAALQAAAAADGATHDEHAIVEHVVRREARPGSGMGFQIAS